MNQPAWVVRRLSLVLRQNLDAVDYNVIDGHATNVSWADIGTYPPPSWANSKRNCAVVPAIPKSLIFTCLNPWESPAHIDISPFGK